MLPEKPAAAKAASSPVSGHRSPSHRLTRETHAVGGDSDLALSLSLSLRHSRHTDTEPCTHARRSRSRSRNRSRNRSRSRLTHSRATDDRTHATATAAARPKNAKTTVLNFDEPRPSSGLELPFAGTTRSARRKAQSGARHNEGTEGTEGRPGHPCSRSIIERPSDRRGPGCVARGRNVRSTYR